MPYKFRAFARVTTFTFAVVVTALWTLNIFYEQHLRIVDTLPLRKSFEEPKNEPKPLKETLRSRLLTEEQCAATFPGLTKEIDDAVARGPFDWEMPPDGYTGLVQVRIKDGKMYIVSVSRDVAENVLGYRSSVLHQLHRAITTSPTPLPDTLFSLCVNDQPRSGSWSFSRPTDASDSTLNHWVMPHFGFWSWPQPFIGPLDKALAKIARIEGETPWVRKIDKAVWRGTVGFNPIGNLKLRPELLRVAMGQDWADVKTLKMEGPGQPPTNVIPIEYFCRYKYIVYTEGVTYSGRLPYHQACASVILTPPITNLQHTSHLIRPIYSSTLLNPPSSPSSELPQSANLTGWTRSFPASEANTVFVAPDWSDLEDTVMYLRANPHIANGIAQRQRELMVDAGYLLPAAEACYWRALIRGWSRVAKTPVDAGQREEWEGGIGKDEDLEIWEGTPWETFSITHKIKWPRSG